MGDFSNKALSLVLLALFCTKAHTSPLERKELIDVEGYLMLDHDYYGPFFNKDEANYQHKTEIRRSKLGLTFSPNTAFRAKIQLKYSRELPGSDNLSLGDAYMRYMLNDNWGLQLGRMKEPFGLEQQTSSSNLLTIERSSLSSSFAPGRSYGLKIDHKKKSHTLAFGYFLERDSQHKFAIAHFNLFEQPASQDTPAATLRFTYAPIIEAQQSVHFGASASKRWFNGNKVQIKHSGEVHSADNIIRSARFYADTSKLYQVDAAWQFNHVLFQTEFVKNSISQKEGKNWDYFGAYIQASYRLSGRYKYRQGRYKSQNKMKNGSFKSSTELVIRQSLLNVRDHDIGSEAAFSLFGFNYYPTANIKLMANLLIPAMSGDSINNDQSGQAYSLRFQYKF